MRIIAGEKRGLSLKTVTQPGFRPTLGRVRESLFAILNPIIADSSVLDLFAGSGALGLEALSRGAKEVLFVDSNPAAIRAMEQNIAHAHYEDRCRVFKGDFTLVGKRVAQDTTFDLVLLDPPYFEGLIPQALDHLVAMNLVAPDGIITLEMQKKETATELNQAFELVREKRYGSTVIWILGHQR